MVIIHEDVRRDLKKGKIPTRVYKLFLDAFLSLDATKNMNLFDIRQLYTKQDQTFYRLRKNKYRAIFYMQKNDFIVIKIAKREEVYKSWE
jgi:mRNA interferase RelE/StbE